MSHPATDPLALTGVGYVGPFGVGRAALAAADLATGAAGRSGVAELTLFEPIGGCEHAAEVQAYDWRDYLFSRQTFADRVTQLAVGGARLALEDAGLALPVAEEAPPVGLVFATQFGCLEAMATFHEPLARGKGRPSSLVFSHSYPNAPTSLLAIEFGLRGYSTTFAGDTRAGWMALRCAADALAAGTAEAILVGATEAITAPRLDHLAHAGALPDTAGLSVEAVAGDPALAARVPGEAALFLVLEREVAARARNATIQALLPTTAGLAVADDPPATPPPERLGHGDVGTVGPLLAYLLHLHATG